MGSKEKIVLDAEGKKNRRLSKWLGTLNKDQRQLLTEYCNESSQKDLNIYFHAYERVLRPSLYILADKNVIEAEKIYARIIEEIALEGINLHNYKNGVEYMKKLDKEKHNIINKYNILTTKGKSEKEIMSEIKADYPLITPNSIKNIILEYKRDKAMASGNTDAALDFIFDNDKKVEENTMTKREQIIGYLSDHAKELKDKDRNEIAKIISKEFGVTHTSAVTYYYEYKKLNPEKKDEDIKPKEEIKEVAPVVTEEKSKFKMLKKTVVVDLAGEFGQYHIENGVVTKEGIVMKNEDEVKRVFEEKKQRAIDLINRQSSEVLELMELYK